MFIKILASVLSLVVLNACSGYSLGNRKPSELSSIQSIAVPLFKNKTQEPRLAALATNSLIDAITRDGTYQITTSNVSDADLIATIETIDYNTRRNERFDSLRASELYVDIQVNWQLVDSQNKVLVSGSDKGRSQFSVDTNQQLSRNNAFPDATKNASEAIVRRIANGF